MWAGWGALYKGGVCSVLSGAEGVLWGMGDFLLRGGGHTPGAGVFDGGGAVGERISWVGCLFLGELVGKGRKVGAICLGGRRRWQPSGGGRQRGGSPWTVT